MLLLAALLLLPTAVSADEPEYTFVLTANGADSCRAAAGDIVTVTLAVRCDSGTDAVYAAQDEIVFDPAFFAFEPDSVLTRSGVKTSTLHLRDGRQAVYMSFISYGSAADWAGETVLGSFRLRVLAEDEGKTPGTLSCRAEDNTIVEVAAPPEMIGEFLQVRITAAMNWALRGERAE